MYYYGGEFAVFVIIAVLVIAALVAAFSIKSKSKTPGSSGSSGSSGSAAGITAKPAAVKPASTEAVKRPAVRKEPEVYEDPNRDIEVIYKNTTDKDVWVCPDCEVENSLSAGYCCLCGHVR